MKQARAPLCSGLARRPLKALARVRIPSGLPPSLRTSCLRRRFSCCGVWAVRGRGPAPHPETVRDALTGPRQTSYSLTRRLDPLSAGYGATGGKQSRPDPGCAGYERLNPLHNLHNLGPATADLTDRPHNLRNSGSRARTTWASARGGGPTGGRQLRPERGAQLLDEPQLFAVIVPRLTTHERVTLCRVTRSYVSSLCG